MKFLAALLVLLCFAPATHATPVGPRAALDSLLLSTASRDSLRERLLVYASHAPSGRAAALALYYRAMSFDRAAMPDSAVANYRRAMAAARSPLVTSAFVDALLRRRGVGDIAEAITALNTLPSAERDPDALQAPADPSRLGWASVLSGDPKRGIELLAPQEQRLAPDPLWKYRFARTYVENKNYAKALPYLLDLNTSARGQDGEIVSMLGHADKALGPNGRTRERTMTEMQKRDDAETPILSRLGGRRVRLKVSDGSLLGGAMFADTLNKRPVRAALVLASLGDQLQDYDSLTVALRHRGFAVFILDPRGSGWSVTPEFPLPETWQGRQDALGARVVRDVRDAITTFARVVRIDTTQVLVVGVVGMAPLALEAAATDARVRAVALLDILASPVDRGAILGAARRAQLPSYLVVSIPGRSEITFADQLFHAGPERTSRLDDSVALGSGAAAFGSRPMVTPRFVRWLDETFAGRPVRRVIPRTTPPSR